MKKDDKAIFHTGLKVVQLLCCGRNIGTARSAIGYCIIPIYPRRKLGVLMKSWRSCLKCSGIFRGAHIIVEKTRV